MKIPNLLSVQQKCLPPSERSSQNLLKVLPFLPLIIGILMVFMSIGNPEALFSSVSMLVSMLFMSLLLVCVVKQSKKKYLKRFTSEQLERMDRECLSAPHYEGLMVTSDALMYFMPAIMAIPIQELVWVYPVAVTHRKGVLLQKTYYTIVAITKNKKKYELMRENRDQERMERSVFFLNEQLKRLRPNLIVGYSEELATLFKKEFNRMVQMADYGYSVGVNKDAVLPKNICEPQEQEVIHV